jgi:CRP-like cAMP-binding protein/Fe-S-cluster-containing dehydrogenase component
MAKAMVEAELSSRAGDEHLSPEQLIKISIFDGLKVANLERYPGAVVLRRYRKGEVVCRQGEAGWTAFYILKAEDLLAIRESQEAANPAELTGLRRHVEQLQSLENAVKHVAEAHPEWASLEADDKRKRAEAIQASDPESADALRKLAEAEAMRAKAVVSLAVPRQQALAPVREGLFTRTMKSLFGVARREAKLVQAYIPIDGPVDLAYENPVATLHEGELFGEMSCINRFPRSATVRVTDDCYMVEMLRNILELLQKNKAFNEQMNAIYRRRVLTGHLRSLPIFSDVSEDFLHQLAQRVELVEKEPGEFLFRQGEPSDCLYVIRIGMVKVTRQEPGGERVLAYRARGEYIGEIGLMKDEPRMANCIALDHPIGEGEKKRRPGRVELIRINRDDFFDVVNRFPEVRVKVEAVVAERSKPEVDGAPAVLRSARFDELGLMQGQKLMLIDLDRCTRCDECVRACADTHADGRTRLLREGPRFGNYLVPASCRQCLDPVCMIGCPVGSIHKGKAGQIVIEDWCIGCEICAKQCPYDSINMHGLNVTADSEAESVDVTKRAVVCDQCSSLSGVPSCVYACPHDAALRVDARSFFAAQTVG